MGASGGVGRATSALAGTGPLTRLALRRDRAQLPVWLLAIAGTVAAVAASIAAVYPTEQDRIGYATATAASVVARAFNGPAAGSDLGAITFNETFTLLVILVPLMSIFTVIRHTRQNEETGRAELIGAAVVGRHAMLTAALLVAVAANTVLAGLIAAALAVTGLPATGSLAAGAAVGGLGIAFAGVAGVAAQVAESARGASGLAIAVLGVAFLLRAAGDASGQVTSDGLAVASAWPSWLSPLGWTSQVGPYRADNWAVLGLFAAAGTLLVGLAFLLAARRDLGTGLIRPRRGPARAAPRLLSPLGLAWRQQAGALAGWLVGFLILGAAFGSLGDEVNEMIAGNEQMAELIAQLGGSDNVVDAYFATMLGLLGLGAAGYALQALLRMRAEEAGGPLEAVLATAVSRPRWLLSHAACAVAGLLALLLVAGGSAGLLHGLVAGDPAGQTWQLALAALAQAPAALVVAGFATAAFGLLPGVARPLSWAVLVACLLLAQVGQVLRLPQPALNLSPFTHTPQLPGTGVDATPLLWLSAAAVALGLLGVVGFDRRDLATN